MKERFGIHSIFVKQLICFALGNAIIVLVMTAIFLSLPEKRFMTE